MDRCAGLLEQAFSLYHASQASLLSLSLDYAAQASRGSRRVLNSFLRFRIHACLRGLFVFFKSIRGIVFALGAHYAVFRIPGHVLSSQRDALKWMNAKNVAGFRTI